MGRGAGNRLRRVVPARVLAGAEIRTVEDLLEAEDLNALFPGFLDEGNVLLPHRLLNVRHRNTLVVDGVAALNQSAADDVVLGLSHDFSGARFE